MIFLKGKWKGFSVDHVINKDPYYVQWTLNTCPDIIGKSKPPKQFYKPKPQPVKQQQIEHDDYNKYSSSAIKPNHNFLNE